MHHKILILPGDGVGKEVVPLTVKVLEALGLNFEPVFGHIGFGAYKNFGNPLPQETVERFNEIKVALFGAVTTPPNINEYTSPILQLRQSFDLYANVRPFPRIPTISDFDLTIIRENTEGLYLGKEEVLKNGTVVGQRILSPKGCRRIIEFALRYSKENRRNKITLAHKANILRKSDGMFLNIFNEISKQNPWIEMNNQLVDSLAMKLVVNPSNFDVIVTSNMFGDIISDLTAGKQSGLGFAASANIGSTHAVFEPVHGSAPDIAGKGIVNPYATLFAAIMLLRYLREESLAIKLHNVINECISKSVLTRDQKGRYTSLEVIESLLSKLN